MDDKTKCDVSMRHKEKTRKINQCSEPKQTVSCLKVPVGVALSESENEPEAVAVLESVLHFLLQAATGRGKRTMNKRTTKPNKKRISSSKKRPVDNIFMNKGSGE